MSEIQAIAFYKSGWSKKKAEKWLKMHKYIPIKDVHETKNMYHYRITDPASGGYKSFVSKSIGPKEDILITIGVRGQSSKPKGELSGNGNYGEHIDIDGSQSSDPIDFQEVYPLSKESGIIEKQIVPPSEFNRSLDHDRVSESDKTDLIISSEREVGKMQHIIPDFPEDTLLGYMMKPKSRGGIGFPFPTSAGTYSPMDWLAMSMFR